MISKVKPEPMKAFGIHANSSYEQDYLSLQNLVNMQRESISQTSRYNKRTWYQLIESRTSRMAYDLPNLDK